MKVLVTSYRTASDRIALAALRGLSLAGFSPWLGTDDPSTASARSRHCHGIIRLHSPISSPEEHAVEVMECVRKHHFSTILPTDDYAVFSLSQAYGQCATDVPLPVPPLEGQQRAIDKASTTELAAALGLNVPETQTVKNKSDLRHELKHILSPWIIKLVQGGGSVGMLISDDPNEVLDHVDSLPDYADHIYDFKTLVVQSYIPGWSEDAYALMYRGQVVRSMASRRLLSWPDQNGSGILSETISKPSFFEKSVELLEALGWHGPANIEFRIDQRSGQSYFIEVNGRLWGTTAMAIAAGVNFPALSCQMAIEDGLRKELSFPAGVRMRFPFPLGLHHLAASSSKLSVGWQLFGPSMRCKSEFWWSDPIPGLLQLRDGIKRVRSGQSARALSPLSIN